MESKRFQRKIEDFVCQNCGLYVRGKGYTNHCPRCLYSRHVDVYPGDRNEGCKGLMKPVSIVIRNGEYIINHKCILCGATRKNVASKDDNIEEIIRLSSNPVV